MAKTKSILNADHPLTIEEAYESRPRLWWIYTLIILIVVSLLGWSGTSINYKGLASKGITIAQTEIRAKMNELMAEAVAQVKAVK